MSDSTKWNSVHNRNQLYREAFVQWGELPQVDMLVEELGECVVATQKLFKRDYSVKRMHDLASEIADVRIMIEEIVLLLDETARKPHDWTESVGSFSELVHEQYLFKLQRTADRLADVRFKLQKTESV